MAWSKPIPGYGEQRGYERQGHVQRGVERVYGPGFTRLPIIQTINYVGVALTKEDFQDLNDAGLEGLTSPSAIRSRRRSKSTAPSTRSSELQSQGQDPATAGFDGGFGDVVRNHSPRPGFPPITRRQCDGTQYKWDLLQQQTFSRGDAFRASSTNWLADRRYRRRVLSSRIHRHHIHHAGRPEEEGPKMAQNSICAAVSAR